MQFVKIEVFTIWFCVAQWAKTALWFMIYIHSYFIYVFVCFVCCSASYQCFHWWSHFLCFQDAYARGEVFIGSRENGYTVVPGLPMNTQGIHWQYGITIVTPDRKFLFACETEKDQKDWIAAFLTVIDRPMLPQEYAGKLKTQLIQYLALFFASVYESDTNLFLFSLQWRPISSTNHDCLIVWRTDGARWRAGEWARPETCTKVLKISYWEPLQKLKGDR